MFLMSISCNGPITLLNVFRSKETHSSGPKEVTVACRFFVVSKAIYEEERKIGRGERLV